MTAHREEWGLDDLAANGTTSPTRPSAVDNNESVSQLGTESKTPFWRRLLPRLLLFILIGVVCLFFSITLAHNILDVNLPRTLDDVQKVATHLETRALSTWQGYLEVSFVFAVLYLWQQAFSVPGSVLLNLLAGHVYGIVIGTLWTSLLTGSGATLAYLLASLVGSPVLEIQWVKRRAATMTRHIEGSKSKTDLFWWMLFVRLFPFSPYWFINLVSPLLGVPVGPFFWSTVLGSMPYNFICAQAGDVLGNLTSTSDILTFSLVVKLLVISFLSLVPVVWGKAIQRSLRRLFGLPPPAEDDAEKLASSADGYEPISHHD